jgi:hypothetical protein
MKKGVYNLLTQPATFTQLKTISVVSLSYSSSRRLSPVFREVTRETRKEWPLLTVETEANGDSKCTNERGPSLVGSLGLSCWSKKILFSALAALVGPVKNIIFLTVHYFNSFISIAQQAGMAVVPGCLSLSICVWGSVRFALRGLIE